VEILIKKKVFLEGLETAKESVERGGTLPMLKNIKLTVKDNSLKLYTTNLATATVLSLRDLSILSEGEALCDALKLIAIVKELPDKEMKIFTEEKGHLIIECEKSYFKLLTMPSEEFPSEPEFPEEKLFPVGEEFFDSLKKVKYAMSKDDTRYTLNGIYLGADMVATDGYRMAVVKRDYPFGGMIVSSDFINLTLKAKNRKELNVFDAGYSENKICLRTDDLILYGRLLEGEFPDYLRVIPNYSPRQASMERVKLYQAIKKTMLMSEKNFQVKFKFNPSSLIISSFIPDLGNAQEEIEAEYISELEENKPLAIALNGKYLLDILETLEEERVTFLMNNEVSAVKIEENNSIHILMPLRLPESEPESEPTEHEFAGEETE
jgi:DNA polymerase-3 subunit beta